MSAVPFPYISEGNLSSPSPLRENLQFCLLQKSTAVLLSLGQNFNDAFETEVVRALVRVLGKNVILIAETLKILVCDSAESSLLAQAKAVKRHCQD